MKKKMRQGFTLVELSIVLVIIGLLIGGILVGQSMINTSKLQSTVKTLQQYEIATQNFQTKYNKLPGDFSAMGCTVRFVNVCDDGIIYSNQSMLAGGNGYRMEESFGFWAQLSKAGMLAEQYRGFDGFGGFAGDFTGYAPKLSYGKNSFLNAMTVTTAMTGGSNPDFGNTWIISGQDTSNPQYGVSLTPVEALAFDTKLDDGKPETGSVEINNAGNHPGPWIFDGQHGQCNSGAAPFPYLITNTNVACSLAIKANW